MSIGSCSLDRAYWIVAIGFGSCLLDRAYWIPARQPASQPPKPFRRIQTLVSELGQKSELGPQAVSASIFHDNPIRCSLSKRRKVFICMMFRASDSSRLTNEMGVREMSMIFLFSLTFLLKSSVINLGVFRFFPNIVLYCWGFLGFTLFQNG